MFDAVARWRRHRARNADARIEHCAGTLQDGDRALDMSRVRFGPNGISASAQLGDVLEALVPSFLRQREMTRRARRKSLRWTSIGRRLRLEDRGADLGDRLATNAGVRVRSRRSPSRATRCPTNIDAVEMRTARETCKAAPHQAHRLHERELVLKLIL